MTATYIVQPGDTLGAIARRCLGDAGRYVEILGRLNGDLYHTTFRQQVEEALLKQEG